MEKSIFMSKSVDFHYAMKVISELFGALLSTCFRIFQALRRLYYGSVLRQYNSGDEYINIDAMLLYWSLCDHR